MKIRLYGLALVAVALAAAAGAVAEPAPGSSTPVRPVRKPVAPARSERDQRVQVQSQARRIDVNNINMFVTNYGTYANDIENQGNSGLFFPKGTIKTAVYQSGIWLGGKIASGPNAGEVRVAIAEYSQEFAPGNIIGSGSTATPAEASDPAFTVYKVVRYTGSASDTDHVERDPAAVAKDRTIDPIAHHSWSEYVNGAAPYGAPTRSYTLPGSTTPVIGPDVKGDQMLWSVYNDLDPAVHINRGGRSAPMGVEVQQSTFAFDRQGALGNTVFLDYKVINKSANSYDSCYVMFWSDPDLGGAGDDLVGCDTLLSMGYIYNATNTDQLYSDRPPAVGYDFFKGPQQGTTTLGLTSFIFYINGTDPQNATQTYNYMRGLSRDGDPITNPDNDEVTRLQFPGDPVTGTGWLDSNPSDRRFMCISGPFTLAAGDTQRIVGAIVISQGGDRLSSITGMKFFDIKAQKAFDIDFDLPPPPPAPKVTFSTDHGIVNLLWDSGSRFNYTPAPGYAFEGYNVYQGASVSGPWKRLKTFDVVNGVKDVRDTVFDVNTGLIVNDTPTAFGGDNGVEYTFSTGQDAIKGGSLKDGSTYFFAVTAYSVNPSPAQGLEKVLETSFQPVAVIVQRPASGTDLAGASAAGATVHRASTAQPPTTEHVIVEVVDPASVTGHTYGITYTSPPTAAPSGVGPSYVWNLVDLTTNETKLANQSARTTSPEYAPVDGMIVKVLGSQSAVPPLNDIYYTPFRADMPFHGVHAGLITFEDSFGYAWDFFDGFNPAADPDSFVNVELRFGSTQQGYVFYRDETASGGAPTAGRGYTYRGRGTVPFTAWDVDNNIQLAVGFVERRVTDADSNPVGAQPATQDATWDPDGSDLGGREYLFISKRAHTTADDPNLAQDGAVAGADTKWLYAAWLYKTSPTQSGDKFVIQVGDREGTPNDTLVFATTKAASGITSLQASKLDDIRAVPNPYYSRSTYELSSFNRIMKFMNMPETATVKIYDLSGHLIRTLRKTDQATSILEWNLENENRLPVASGVYVYTVDVPNVGTHTGRLVVFMEKERLQNF